MTGVRSVEYADGSRSWCVPAGHERHVGDAIAEWMTRQHRDGRPWHPDLWTFALRLRAEAPAEASGSVAASADVSGCDTEDAAPPLSACEVAQQHDVGAHAVRLAAREHRLRGHKVGGHWTFRQADVDAWTPRGSA